MKALFVLLIFVETFHILKSHFLFNSLETLIPQEAFLFLNNSTNEKDFTILYLQERNIISTLSSPNKELSLLENRYAFRNLNNPKLFFYHLNSFSQEHFNSLLLNPERTLVLSRDIVIFFSSSLCVSPFNLKLFHLIPTQVYCYSSSLFKLNLELNLTPPILSIFNLIPSLIPTFVGVTNQNSSLISFVPPIIIQNTGIRFLTPSICRKMSPFAFPNAFLAILCGIKKNYTILLTSGYEIPSSLCLNSIGKHRPLSSLFHYGNYLETGFIVPVDNQALDFKGILGPLDLPVIIWTFSLAAAMILFLFYVTKIGKSLGLTENGITMQGSVEVVLRPILDQCTEKATVGKDFFRLALSQWLIYSLLVTEIYRGELTSYLVRPPENVVPETFRELADSNIPVFVSGYFLPSNHTHGVLIEDKEKNCSFKVFGSNEILALDLAEKHSKHNNSFTKLLKYLLACDGSGIVRNFSSCVKRLAVTNEVYIMRSVGLENVKSVVSLAAPHKDFRISKEMLRQRIVLSVAGGVHHPYIWGLLNRLQDGGFFDYQRKADKIMGFIMFWSNWKPNNKRSNTVGNLKRLGVDIDIGQRGKGGPIPLKMYHVKTVLALCLFLELAALFLWVGEVFYRK